MIPHQPSTSNAIRYTLIALHIVITLACFLITAILVFNFINMIFSAGALLALLIYIPAALVFAIKRSNNHFTHAGGEVAYVVMQMILWIGSAATALAFRVDAYCVNYYDRPAQIYVDNVRTCESFVALAALSLVQVLMMIGWLVLIVVHVKKNAKGESRSMKVIYNVPVERLLEGKRGIEGVGLSKLDSRETVVV